MTNDTAPLTWEEYNESGRRLFAAGDLAGADEAFTAAIAEAERQGDDPLHLASSLSSLAQLKYQQKDALRAEELFRRALTLREQALGPDDKSVITSINNLAALYVSRGALDDAEPLLKRAMAASVKRVESSQGDLAINLNNLARLYFKRGAYAQAEPLLLRLLTLKRPMGPEHPEVATVLVSLAKVRHALGKHDAAERVWRRVLNVRERTLAPTDPSVLQAIDGLADALAGQGKLGPACDLRERALAPRLESMGADHPLVAAMRTKLEETRAALAASTSSTTTPIRVKRPVALETTATSGLTPVSDRAPIELDTAPVVVATPTVRRSMPVHAATDGESGFGGRIAAAAGHNGVNGRAPTPAPVQWIEPVSKPRVVSVDKVPVEAAAAATAATTVELTEADVRDDAEDDADEPALRKPSLNFGRMVGGRSQGSGRGLTIALGVIAAVGCIAVAGIVLGPSLLAKLRTAPSAAAVAVAAPIRHAVAAARAPAVTAPAPAPTAVDSTATTQLAATPVATPVATPAAAPVATPKAAAPAPVATRTASGPPAPANGFAAHMGRLPAPDTQATPAAPALPPPVAAAPAPTRASHAAGAAAPPDQDLLPPPPSVDIDSAKKP